MKNLLVSVAIVCLAHYSSTAQTLNESALPSNGITHQIGPGSNNSVKAWTYPYGVKLSIYEGQQRNFEIMNTHKGATSTLAFRTYDGNAGNWTGWREMLYKDSQKRLLFNVKTFFSKAVSNYDGDLLLQSTNTGLLGNYGASISFSKLSGGLNKRAAIVAKQTGTDVDNIGLAFLTHGNTGADDLIESMVIDGLGRVGIGTSNPRYSLDIKTNSTYEGNNLYFGNRRFYLAGITGNGDQMYGGLVLKNLGSGVRAVDLVVGNNNFAANNSPENTMIRFQSNGRVGIGTSDPDSKLTVKGIIHSEEVKVDLNVPGPDYVFEEDYDLISLEETKAYIDANKHLPEVPSAKEMEADGINLSDFSMTLLKKVEEMTLHQIELMETVKNQNSELRKQNAKIELLQKQLEALKNK